MPSDTIQQGLARRQLPSSQSFSEKELEQGTQYDRPDHGRAQHRTGESSGRQITRTDTRGRDKQPGTNHHQQPTTTVRHAKKVLASG